MKDWRISLQFEMLKDNIGVWHNCMSRSWCDSLIAAFDQKLIEIESAYPDIKDNDDIESFMFRNNQKRIDKSTVLEKYARFHDYDYQLKQQLEICLNEYWRAIVGKHNENEQNSPWGRFLEEVECKIQRTPPDGGFCTWHYEQGQDYHCSRRFAVWMIYLNDVNKGGKTDFPNQGLSVKPEAGKMVIWPAAYTHTHRSAPDLKEWKYIVTGWFIYKDADDPQNRKEFEPSRIRKSSS